jgi:uncharacterized delta-60 repeat protein
VARARAFIPALLAVLAVLAAPAAASRRSPSSHDWAFGLAIQNDGKVVAAGLTNCCGDRGLAVARYLPDGRLDQRFGHDGKVVAQGHGYGAAVAIAPDGKIVVAGGTGGGLVRLTAKGSPDAAFGHAGRVATGPVFAVAVQPDGKIVAGGSRLARYTARGALDRAFGRSGRRSMTVHDLGLQRDGRIVVASDDLVRFDADGDPDPHFAGRGPEFGVSSVDVDGRGAIVAAGGGVSDVDERDVGVARLTPDGLLDPSFGVDGVAHARGCASTFDEAVATQRDGKVVVVMSGPGCASFKVFRFDGDGNLDESFGRGGKVLTRFVRRPGTEPSSSWAEAVALQRNARIVVAGLGRGYDFGLARYLPKGRLDPSFGRGGTVLTDFGSG